MKVLKYEHVNDLRQSLFHLLNCLITTASELREQPKVTEWTIGGDELSWCPSLSNSLWQGWSWGLVHCPGGNLFLNSHTNWIVNKIFYIILNPKKAFKCSDSTIFARSNWLHAIALPWTLVRMKMLPGTWFELRSPVTFATMILVR